MKIATTYRKLREMFDAVTALAGRTLPSIRSDLKIAKLKRALADLHRDTEAAREGAIRRHPCPPDTEEFRTPAIVLEARGLEIAEFLDGTVDLEIADTLLVEEDDLPKAMKGESGEMNRTGIGTIVAGLGPLFKDSE